MKLLVFLLALCSCVATPPLRTSNEDFWALADRLATDLPVKRTLYVAIVDLPPELLGKTSQWPFSNSLMISVDWEQDINGMLDTLIHEWAHAIVWDTGDLDHGPLWGVAYSLAYQIKVGWKPGTCLNGFPVEHEFTTTNGKIKCYAN